MIHALLPYLWFALGLNFLFFIPAYFFQTDKLTDLTYALTFIFMAQYALFIDGYSMPALIVAGMVTLWGLRLGGFLFLRVMKNKKDKRFDPFRNSPLLFGRFFVLQGLTAWVILIPSLWFILGSGQVQWLGVFVWAFGFLFESIADYQKWTFRKKKSNKNKFISTGLWSLSRHPNYFGEITLWIGVYLSVVQSLTGWQQVVGLVSPLFITLIITKATGLPQLESSADERWGKEKAYQNYKKNTPILIPKLS